MMGPVGGCTPLPHCWTSSEDSGSPRCCSQRTAKLHTSVSLQIALPRPSILQSSSADNGKLVVLPVCVSKIVVWTSMTRTQYVQITLESVADMVTHVDRCIMFQKSLNCGLILSPRTVFHMPCNDAAMLTWPGDCRIYRCQRGWICLGTHEWPAIMERHNSEVAKRTRQLLVAINIGFCASIMAVMQTKTSEPPLQRHMPGVAKVYQPRGKRLISLRFTLICIGRSCTCRVATVSRRLMWPSVISTV